MDFDDVAEGAGWFLSILGSLVMGLSVGLGLASYTAHRRFACGLVRTDPGIVNVTAACSDVLGAWNMMTLAAAAGGVVVFLSGMIVMVYGKRQQP